MIAVVYRDDEGELLFVDEHGQSCSMEELESDDYEALSSLTSDVFANLSNGQAFLVPSDVYEKYQGGDAQGDAEGDAPGDSEESDRAGEPADEPGVEAGDIDNGGKANQSDDQSDDVLLLDEFDGDTDDGDGNPEGDGEGPGDPADATDYGDGQGEDSDENNDNDAADGGEGEEEDMSAEQNDQGAPELQGDPEWSDEATDMSTDGENPIVDDLLQDGLEEIIQAIAKARAKDAGEWSFQGAVSYLRNRAGVTPEQEHQDIVVEYDPVKLDPAEMPEVRHFKYEELLRVLMVGDAYIPGPPGTGKSHIVEQIAGQLGRPFSLFSCSPLDTPTKWFGYQDANGTPRLDGTLYDAFVEGHIVCIDEMDNSNASMITGLNSLVANRAFQFPGKGLVKAHEDFRVVGTANTFGTGPTAEFAGRCRLDPATLDRFSIVPMGVDEGIETLLVEAIVGSKDAERWLKRVRHARRAVEALRIKHFVTMRGAIEGAKLLKAGFKLDEAYGLRIVGTLNDDVRKKIDAWS